MPYYILSYLFFFFNDTATTEIYTLSLHDALPISRAGRQAVQRPDYRALPTGGVDRQARPRRRQRSEEHTSELQSHSDLVCRLLLEKKKKRKTKVPSEDHEGLQEDVVLTTIVLG